MPRKFSPPPRVRDPDMHHGTCVTHVPWCKPGFLTSSFLTSRWLEKRSRHYRRMRNRQFYVSGKRPIGFIAVLRGFMWSMWHLASEFLHCHWVSRMITQVPRKFLWRIWVKSIGIIPQRNAMTRQIWAWFLRRLTVYDIAMSLGTLLLKWFNFNSSIDKSLYPVWGVGLNYLSFPKLQRCNT